MWKYVIEYKNSSTGIPTSGWKEDEKFHSLDDAIVRALHIQPAVGGRVKITRKHEPLEDVVWEFYPDSVGEVNYIKGDG